MSNWEQVSDTFVKKVNLLFILRSNQESFQTNNAIARANMLYMGKILGTHQNLRSSRRLTDGD